MKLQIVLKRKGTLKTAQSDLNKEQARIEKLQGKLKEEKQKELPWLIS